jgi:acetylornithine deacetylase/succinyl-diaminopimelate desuccinylase-like protein
LRNSFKGFKCGLKAVWDSNALALPWKPGGSPLLQQGGATLQRRGKVAHLPDEYVLVEDVITSAKVMALTALRLLGTE